MSYSRQALEFQRIPVDAHVRVSDRVSFLYLEYCRVTQDRTGVVALLEEEGDLVKLGIQIPVGSIALVMLGPGTSITQPAAATMARSGATLMFTGGNGHPTHSTASPLTGSARWSQAQARLWANDSARIAAAKELYRVRFQEETPKDNAMSISRLRGLEGRRVRDEYRRRSAQNRVAGFRRDTTSDDPVNVGLNIGNSILYGLAGSVCSALGLNPALGIIHNGDVRAFLFDLADVYKSTITIPVAFASTSEKDPALFVRRKVRQLIRREEIFTSMTNLVMNLLHPYLGAVEADTLIDEDENVLGHTNYELREP